MKILVLLFIFSLVLLGQEFLIKRTPFHKEGVVIHKYEDEHARCYVAIDNKEVAISCLPKS